MSLANIAPIKEIINNYGLAPSALNGQNFLVDEMVLQTIMETAAIKPDENILEIGPGLGVLTAELLAAGAKVTAVEKDRQIFSYLKKRFKGEANLILANEDILQFKIPPAPYRIVANIPYSITAKIIRKFTADEVNKPSSLLIMVQKEVAERVCARPGKLNLLAICAQLYGQPSIIATVPARAFYPVPKVDSALLLIDNIQEQPRFPLDNLGNFWRLARLGFSSPRKQLHNNLAAGLKIDSQKIKDALVALKMKDKARAQELAIGQWISLLKAIDKG